MQFTLMFPERLDTKNAAAFEDACIQQTKDLPPETKLIMDMEQLGYISSTGLRVVLKLKKRFTKCMLVNVGQEVYEILELAGFAAFLPIRRKPMVIAPVEGEPIARGSNGEIYILEEDTIVKMFSERTSIEEIEAEWANARTAFSLGVPSVICYAVVNDGKRNGILFEKLRTRTLDRLIYDDYENFDRYARMFARLLYDIHQTQDLRRELQSIREMQISVVERADYLTAKEKEDLQSFLMTIPDSDHVIHGDFHPRNIGMANDELIVMDMAEIGLGHPVFDFVSTYFDLVFSGTVAPETTPDYFGLKLPDLRRLWDQLLPIYFGDLTEAETAWINELMDTLVGLRLIQLPVLHPNKPKEKHEMWIRNGRERLSGKLDELGEKIRQFDADFIRRGEHGAADPA